MHIRGLWLALLVAVGCEPDDAGVADTAAPLDTGAAELAPRALGGQAPGVVTTLDQPLSTFPLDGSLPYDGPLPEPPGQGRRFAVETRFGGAQPSWRLDVGLAAGPEAAHVRDVGVRLAFNPHAVRRYRLQGATGTGHGIEIQRVPELVPGTRVGATFDLWPTSPTGADGAPRPFRGFLGTLTVSWTEDGAPHEQVIVLEREER